MVNDTKLKFSVTNCARAEYVYLDVRPAYSICTLMESGDVLYEYL
jgi:hypothetical protein